MKILILCPSPKALLLDNGFINNQGTIYAYHFSKRLSKNSDCEINFGNSAMTLDEVNATDNYDFCLCLINRGIKAMRPSVFNILKTKIKYQIITICGSNSIVDKEDLLLFMMGKSKPRTKRIFWGADFELLKPLKSDTITILVDHKYYGKKTSRLYKIDMTELIIKSLINYRKAGNNIIIKHIGYGAVNDVDDNYIASEYKQSQCMDFREIYKYYCQSHIYVVTHPECLGLTTIECASTGALIVHPNGYIKNEIINKLHHYTINNINNVDWSDIISKINIEKSIQCAKHFSYDTASTVLYNHMKTFIKP